MLAFYEIYDRRWNKFIDIRCSQTSAHTEENDYVQLTIPGIFDDGISLGETVQKENTLEIVSGNKTQEQMLADLNIVKAADYCKYLRIPLNNF